MTRVASLDQDAAAESVRPIYEGVTRKLGLVPNFFKVLAHSPEAFQGFLALDGALGKMQLPPKYRELAYLKTSQVNGCAYCQHYHRIFGAKAGLGAGQLNGLADFEASDDYDDRDKAVLRFAEAVTRDVRADDATLGRLREFLSERELVELTITVALANFTNRVNETLAIDLP